ncbi:MAG TPA: 50S ribosomal protein L21 [Kofleriaceae bacterium]|jgi:large subunit ribosomal protein L21|nr:50S ribosomal protein L21 [Kofleriaceae bacterium]
MYAVIETGGKQYRVEAGQLLTCEKLPGNAGDKVEFERVLLLSDDEKVAVGRPLVDGARVTGEIVKQDMGEKLTVYKFRRRKNYRRKTGHRQQYTTVKISEVVGP